MLKILLDDVIKNDDDGFKLLKTISYLPFTECAIALPDFHLKEKMEAPSSIAVATKNCIVPHFSSCSLNCGMGFINTGLNKKNISSKKINLFFRYFRDSTKTSLYNITHDELADICVKGAKVIINKFHLPINMLEAIEKKGNCLNGDRILQDLTYFFDMDDLRNKEYIGLKNLGLGFGGNHFLEIQEISEIINKEECDKYNLKMGDIAIMYHGGGGIVPGFIGAYFSRRLKGYKQDIRLLYNKLKFHYLDWEGIFNFIPRWKYFFSKKRFVPIIEKTKEGQRCIMANMIAMNYGYAYRMVIIARIRDILKKIYPSSALDINLLFDRSHNSILNEEINGKFYWVHRHNTCMIREGLFGILPGYENTSSFVGIGMKGAKNYYNSMPHGAGDTIKRYAQKGISKPINGRFTQKYLNNSDEPKKINHITDEGIEKIIKLLKKENIFQPIARVTPLGVLNDYRY